LSHRAVAVEIPNLVLRHGGVTENRQQFSQLGLFAARPLVVLVLIRPFQNRFQLGQQPITISQHRIGNDSGIWPEVAGERLELQ
jgi:hypothetical protein